MRTGIEKLLRGAPLGSLHRAPADITAAETIFPLDFIDGFVSAFLRGFYIITESSNAKDASAGADEIAIGIL